MCRLAGDVRRAGTQRRGRRRSASAICFADVTLLRTRGRFRRGNNEGEFADTAASLNYCAAIGLRRSRMKNATGHASEARAPRRHLVGLFCACLFFSLQVANSAEQITELGWLQRPLGRFLRHRWRLPRARGRVRKSEDKGRRARMAWSLNRMATTDPRAARVKKRSRANIADHGPEAMLGSSASGSLAFFPGRRPSPPGS